MVRNYQKELEQKITEQQKLGKTPKLLLHSCCAPCSSYVLEYLSPYFHICDFYYNPNISPKREYEERKEELMRLIKEMSLQEKVTFLEGTYEPEKFFEMAKGLEGLPEGGERCFKCYELRLEETAKMAKQLGFMYFATTLTISPLKNATVLNEKGFRAQEKYGVKYLATDLKKGGGYLESIRLSKEHGLYRQNYCGCSFSKTK